MEEPSFFVLFFHQELVSGQEPLRFVLSSRVRADSFLSVESAGNAKTGISVKSGTDDGSEDIHLPQLGEDLATARSNEHLKNIASDLSVKIEIYIDHSGPAETAVVTDSASIK